MDKKTASRSLTLVLSLLLVTLITHTLTQGVLPVSTTEKGNACQIGVSFVKAVAGKSCTDQSTQGAYLAEYQCNDGQKGTFTSEDTKINVSRCTPLSIWESKARTKCFYLSACKPNTLSLQNNDMTLTSDGIRIIVGGKQFSVPQDAKVQTMFSKNQGKIVLSWKENNIDMALLLTLSARPPAWFIENISSYDGSKNQKTLMYDLTGKNINGPLGKMGGFSSVEELKNQKSDREATLLIANMRLQAFKKQYQTAFPGTLHIENVASKNQQIALQTNVTVTNQANESKTYTVNKTADIVLDSGYYTIAVSPIAGYTISNWRCQGECQSFRKIYPDPLFYQSTSTGIGLSGKGYVVILFKFQ